MLNQTKEGLIVAQSNSTKTALDAKKAPILHYLDE